MISEQDIQDYFHQIMAIEQKMEAIYGKLNLEVTTDPYRRIFRKLLEEEQEHQVHLQTVIKAFASLPQGNKEDLGNCMVGQKAPAFAGQAAVGDAIASVSYASGILKVGQDVFKDRYLVLFFYPMDFAYVSPTEIIAFDDALSDFEKLNTTVMGISVDTVYAHLAFKNTSREKRGLGPIRIPLLSDMSRRISRDYGVLMDESVSARATFIIDDQGILQSASINNLSVGRSIAEVLRCVAALQNAGQAGAPSGNWNPVETTMVNLLEQGKKKT